MKMMKKLAMSLALGLGLSLLGGGQGMGAQQAQPGREVFHDDLNEDAEIILQEMNRGFTNRCGNVLVAYVNIKNLIRISESCYILPGSRYIVLQSGLACNASDELHGKIHEKLTDLVSVLDGAIAIEIISGGPGVAKDIRTLARGGNLVGQGGNPLEQQQNKNARLQAIVQALKTYAEKCQQNGFTNVPDNWNEVGSFGITEWYYVGYNGKWRTCNGDATHLMGEIGKISDGNLEAVLSYILQYLNSGQGIDGCSTPADPINYAGDCANKILGSWNNGGNKKPSFNKICNALRWFRYALHTEIQLALLKKGQKVTLVPYSPILSLKDPCLSCEQGANHAWDHQDHKFFSIQGDSAKGHQFSTKNGTIISRRYCTWKKT